MDKSLHTISEPIRVSLILFNMSSHLICTCGKVFLLSNVLGKGRISRVKKKKILYEEKVAIVKSQKPKRNIVHLRMFRISGDNCIKKRKANLTWRITESTVFCGDEGRWSNICFKPEK